MEGGRHIWRCIHCTDVKEAKSYACANQMRLKHLKSRHAKEYAKYREQKEKRLYMDTKKKGKAFTWVCPLCPAGLYGDPGSDLNCQRRTRHAKSHPKAKKEKFKVAKDEEWRARQGEKVREGRVRKGVDEKKVHQKAQGSIDVQYRMRQLLLAKDSEHKIKHWNFENLSATSTKKNWRVGRRAVQCEECGKIKNDVRLLGECAPYHRAMARGLQKRIEAYEKAKRRTQDPTFLKTLEALIEMTTIALRKTQSRKEGDVRGDLSLKTNAEARNRHKSSKVKAKGRVMIRKLKTNKDIVAAGLTKPCSNGASTSGRNKRKGPREPPLPVSKVGRF